MASCSSSKTGMPQERYSRRVNAMSSVTSMLSTPLVIDDSGTRAGLSETQRSWKVQINPFRYRQEAVGVDPDTEETVDFETWLSPAWLATQVVQAAELSAGEEPVYRDLSADALAVEGSTRQTR